MVFPKARLVVSGLLFLSWLGFLLFLVVRSRTAVILSRPQVLVADLCVLAEIKGEASERPPYKVKVEKVLFSKDATSKSIVGEELPIIDLQFITPRQGWQGTGTYLIPLSRVQREKDNFETMVTALPPVPGYYPATFTIRIDDKNKKMDKQTMLGLLERFMRLPKDLIEPMLMNLPADVGRNVPRDEADAFSREATKTGTSVELIPAEARIYLATPDILRQFDAIHLR